MCKGSSKNALSLSLKTVRFDLSDYRELVIGQDKSDSYRTNENQVANGHKPLKFDHVAHDNQSKSMKK